MRALPLAVALAVATSTGPVGARELPATTGSHAPATSRVQVLDALAGLLRDNYVSPQTGIAYAERLQERARADAHQELASDAAFAEAVTAELHALHRDAHLRVSAPQPEGAGGPAPAMSGKKRREPPKPIAASGWLDEGVAYIAFNIFLGEPQTLAQLETFLDAHASAQVLVIDVRRHFGGDLKEMDVVFSRLFAQRTPLLQMDARAAAEVVHGPVFEEGPTLRRIDGPTGVVRREHFALPGRDTPLRRAKVYVLTSRGTISAGEHLALALKRTHRATLVGETTHGAGNFGDPYPLPGGFSAFIPTGRTFDPDTNLGWEGIGVAPDLDAPAADALRVALKHMGRDSALAAKFDAAAPAAGG